MALLSHGGIYLLPTSQDVDPNLKPHPYDPEKAKALLKEAGYPNGFDTTFNYGLLGDKIEVQAMAADLARVGIRAKLVELEAGTYIRNVREKKFRGLGRGINPMLGRHVTPGRSHGVISFLGKFLVLLYDTGD